MSSVSVPQPAPFLVVFGQDHAGKPHASWFDQASAELATKAASLMNMRAVPIETDALRELAGTLPRGRVFSSGRAFTPFVKGKLYERLIELTRDLLGLHQDAANENAAEDGANPTESDAAEPAETPTGDDPQRGETAVTITASSAAGIQPRPTQAGEIGMGSLVLACSAEEGWFEAEVIGLNGGMLTLRWRDYNEPTIVRRRHELGFLPVALA